MFVPAKMLALQNYPVIMPPPVGKGAFSDDARLTSVCRVHRD